MRDLYAIFNNLRSVEGNEKYFQVEEIYPDLPHKLGCSPEGFPIVFVECADFMPTTNIKLKLFEVNFNQLCSLKEGKNQPISKKYSIIQLKSSDKDYQKYFIEVITLVFRRLPSIPMVADLKKEVSKVISMFIASPTFSIEVVKGLWAELFVIAHSKLPLYLIKSWHVSPDDKYDFNDGVDKIEVKSTGNIERIHTFSLEQLNPNTNSQLAIASVITISSGQGANIFDLIDVISNIVSDSEALVKLQEIALLTIGPHIEEASKIRFDQNMALNSYAIYDYKVVPTIKSKDVPVEVSSVRFSTCLKDCTSLDTSLVNSDLIKSL